MKLIEDENVGVVERTTFSKIINEKGITLIALVITIIIILIITGIVLNTILGNSRNNCKNNLDKICNRI